jgi:glycosyltransferase involved in cell wall biosynthesis
MGFTADVSIIIPVYNNISYLEETLRSVLNQTLQPKEVVVVDDGSTKLSVASARTVGEFVSGLADPRIRCIEQANSGPPGARNAGASVAQASWLAFCDGDDLWLPSKLERQFSLLQNDPACQYCIVDYTNLVSDELLLKSHFDWAPADFWDRSRRDFGPAGFILDRNLFLDFLRFQPAHPSTVLISRKHFETVGRWNPAVARMNAEDFEFHLRCANHPPMGVVPEVLVHYRKHGASLSADELRQQYASTQILRYMLETYGAAQQNEARFRAEIESRLLECCREAFYQGRMDLFRKFYMELPRDRRPLDLRARHVLSLLPKPVSHALRAAVRRGKHLAAP